MSGWFPRPPVFTIPETSFIEKRSTATSATSAEELDALV
jgi:hypothetical protein